MTRRCRGIAIFRSKTHSWISVFRASVPFPNIAVRAACSQDPRLALSLQASSHGRRLHGYLEIRRGFHKINKIRVLTR